MHTLWCMTKRDDQNSSTYGVILRNNASACAYRKQCRHSGRHQRSDELTVGMSWTQTSPTHIDSDVPLSVYVVVQCCDELTVGLGLAIRNP